MSRGRFLYIFYVSKCFFIYTKYVFKTYKIRIYLITSTFITRHSSLLYLRVCENHIHRIGWVLNSEDIARVLMYGLQDSHIFIYNYPEIRAIAVQFHA